MIESKATLLEAVKLLDEIIGGIMTSTIAEGGEGSSGLLLIQLQKLREMLWTELQRRQPSWPLVAEMLKEAVRLIWWAINNIQYILRPACPGHRGIQVGTRTHAEILAA